MIILFLKMCSFMQMAMSQREEVSKELRSGDMVRDQERSTSAEDASEQPPDDFRQIPIMPSAEEIRTNEIPFLRKNIIFEAYR